jgi:hypothetical protein
VQSAGEFSYLCVDLHTRSRYENREDGWESEDVEDRNPTRNQLLRDVRLENSSLQSEYSMINDAISGAGEVERRRNVEGTARAPRGILNCWSQYRARLIKTQLKTSRWDSNGA